MKVSVAIAGSALLLAFQCLAQTQTATPTPQPSAQPSYPSAPPPRNRVNPAAQEPTREADEPRCANLKGLEKAECERRDNTDDDAPAGVTSSMREKQKEAAKENADTDTAAETAKKKVEEKANSGADGADTLGKPPA